MNMKLFSRIRKVNLLQVLGRLTDSQLLKGSQTLGEFREIEMKLLFRLGKANLLERL